MDLTKEEFHMSASQPSYTVMMLCLIIVFIKLEQCFWIKTVVTWGCNTLGEVCRKYQVYRFCHTGWSNSGYQHFEMARMAG
jgi:hypothetical protein